MRFVITLICLSSFSVAQNNQLSLYLHAPTPKIFDPGYGVEWAMALSPQAVLAVSLDASSPEPTNERLLQLNVDGRFHMSAGIDAYWYPQLSGHWSLQEQRFSHSFGLGYSKQWTPLLGYFTRASWQPDVVDFEVGAGFTIWLDALSNFDTRINRATPMGAVYRSGSNEQSTKQSSKNTAAKLTTENSVASVSTEPVELELITLEPIENTSVVTHKTPAQQPTAQVVSADVAVSPTQLPSGLYLHLGAFAQKSSANVLKTDPRLGILDDQIYQWFDQSRALYRLLMGPFTEAVARSKQQTLKSIKIDSFLFTMD